MAVEMLEYLNPEVYGWCENLDAAMFSGDTFDEKMVRDEFRFYVERWLREMDRKEVREKEDGI